MKISKKNFKIILVILGLILLLFISYLILQARKESQKIKPAELTAIKLVDENCENCFDLEQLLTVLKKQNVVFKNIEQVDIKTEQGKKLMEKNKISKLPILFIEGEIDKDENFKKIWKGFGQSNDKMLISNVFPPYKDLFTGEMVGLVDATIIYDKTCQECYNTKAHIAYLETEGIFPENINKLDIADDAAQQLIEKYNITKAPTIILSPSAKEYKRLADNWENDGFVADDGYYIFTATEKIGIYKDLITNKIIEQ